MRVRCVRPLTNDEKKRLNLSSAGAEVGEEFRVVAIEVSSGNVIYSLAEEEVGYLFLAPAIVFEITDPRVPPIWEVDVDESEGLYVAPRELIGDPHLHEDIVNGVRPAKSTFNMIIRSLDEWERQVPRPDER